MELYLSWEVCYGMLQKSHHHRRHHRRGQQALGGTSFSLQWAARASGPPSVTEHRWHQTHQCPLWVEGQDKPAVSQGGCTSWLYRRGKKEQYHHQELVVSVHPQNTLTGPNNLHPLLIQNVPQCRINWSLRPKKVQGHWFLREYELTQVKWALTLRCPHTLLPSQSFEDDNLKNDKTVI